MTKIHTNILILSASILFMSAFTLLVIVVIYGNVKPSDKISLVATKLTSDIVVKVNYLKKYPINSTTQEQRVTANVSITNNSNQELQISPGLQIQLADRNNNYYSMTADYLPKSVVLGGPLSPGATWTKPIDFNIPAGRTPIKLVFQTAINSKPLVIGIN